MGETVHGQLEVKRAEVGGETFLISPLMTAIQNADVDMVKARLQSGDKVNSWIEGDVYGITSHQTPMLSALLGTKKGDHMAERKEILKHFLKQPEAKDALNHELPQFSSNLIEYVTHSDSKEAAKILLEADKEQKSHLLSPAQKLSLQRFTGEKSADAAVGLPAEKVAEIQTTSQAHLPQGSGSYAAQPVTKNTPQVG